MRHPNCGADQHEYADTVRPVAGGPNAQPGQITFAVAAILHSAFLELLTTQEAFGLRLGIPRSTMGEYLRGQRVIDLETFARLCDALYLDPVRVMEAALSFDVE